jgi:hypothetical protein
MMVKNLTSSSASTFPSLRQRTIPNRFSVRQVERIERRGFRKRADDGVCVFTNVPFGIQFVERSSQVLCLVLLGEALLVARERPVRRSVRCHLHS